VAASGASPSPLAVEEQLEQVKGKLRHALTRHLSEDVISGLRLHLKDLKRTVRGNRKNGATARAKALSEQKAREKAEREEAARRAAMLVVKEVPEPVGPPLKFLGLSANMLTEASVTALADAMKEKKSQQGDRLELLLLDLRDNSSRLYDAATSGGPLAELHKLAELKL
jgi:hypothetical protein